MIGNFSEEAQMVLIDARNEMISLKHKCIGTEHLMLAILKNDFDISKKLNIYKLNYNNYKEKLSKIIPQDNCENFCLIYSPVLSDILNKAINYSRNNNNIEITTLMLFSFMFEEIDCKAIRIMIDMGINIDKIYEDFSFPIIFKKSKKKCKNSILDSIGTDLTNEAKFGKLDNAYGRLKEINRIIEILCRKNKNNPILIGEAGVGKTAIIEELAIMINKGNVPDKLKNKKIISLDIASLVSGTKYRGEFEEKIKKMLKEIEDNPDIILFIDEIHTIVGAGGAEGAIDASNILKPALSRGKIKCIGATTFYEYKKYILKDSAFERRFQKVYVSEPNQEEVKYILLNIKKKYEKFHNVTVNDNIIDKIIFLSDKYVSGRRSPDKEIDLLDEVCSKVSLKVKNNNYDVNKIKQDLGILNKKKNDYIICNQIEEAYKIRKTEIELEKKMYNLNNSFNKKKEMIVRIDDVYDVISSLYNIKTFPSSKDIFNFFNNVRSKLKNKVIGEDNVIDSLIDYSLKIEYESLNRCHSLLFIGPYGVGKKYLAEEYAKQFVKEDHIIKIDMTEYNDSTSINKITGLYSDLSNYSCLFEEIFNKPNCYLILSNIDKAHKDIISLFKKIISEGKIKDHYGKIINFNGVRIIFTINSNCNSKEIGFLSNNSDNKCFSDNKFLNMFDEIFYFKSLNEASIKNIIKNEFTKLSSVNFDLQFKLNSTLENDILNKCDYKICGASKINKTVNEFLNNQILKTVTQNFSKLENKKNITI